VPTVRGIWENVIAGLIGLAIIAVGSLLLSRIGASIPLWAAFVVAVLAAIGGLIFGRATQDRSDLPAYQADLLGEAILALRVYATGRLGVSFDDLIERGILDPARFGMTVVAGEEIRLSILELDDSGEVFKMRYQSGHTLGRKENFSLPRVSLAGHAFDAKELKWTDDVDADPRWQPHPLAQQRHRYRSLASMPVVVGDESVAVLNVVSTETSAFLGGDLTFIELLGALLALAWDIRIAAASATNVDLEKEKLEGMESGSIPMGPSELYLQLLKGEISPESYAEQAKKRIHATANERPKGRRTAVQRQRSTRR
jgi:GAF domain